MWTRNDIARSLKVRQAPLSLMCSASIFLLHFKTCFKHGGHFSAYFDRLSPGFRQIMIFKQPHFLLSKFIAVSLWLYVL